jgi:hypothetical protein
VIASNIQHFPRPKAAAHRVVVHLVPTLFVGLLLGVLISLVFAAPSQPSAAQRCEAGHDPLAESCLASGATPKMRPQRGFKARKSAS